MAHLLLFTDRPDLEASVRAASIKAGLDVSVHTLNAVADVLKPAGAAALFDAAAANCDEDELLASVGLARAFGLPAAVILPEAERYASIEDLLYELCGGCVAHDTEELERIVFNLARRLEAGRDERFEYLSVSPRGSELLAILGDGRALLLPRPLSSEDGGGEVKAIQLSADARSAEIELVSGSRLTLRSSALAPPRPNGSAEATASLADIDGATLGRRLRSLRLAAGLTQAELARRTGIHRPNIARVEAGRHTPSLETLARLAQAIGVPTTRVLSG
jgi:DNA-binding XRE family transcriptional regulator